MQKKFTKEQVEYIKEKSVHFTRQQISKNLGLTVGQVEYLSRINNIKLTIKEPPVYKYEFNHNYFDIVDTPNKSYILGFIFADGCIYKTHERSRLSINLSIKDKCILDFIKKELNGTFPIVCKYNGGKFCRITIDSRHMIDRLIEIGIKPLKTYDKDVPNIPNEFKKYFLLGYFDGDGCIYRRTRQIRGREKKDYSWSICAKLKERLENIRTINNLEKYGYVTESRKGEYTLGIWYVYSKKQIIDIYNLLYDDKSWCLERKRKIMEKVIND